MGYESYIDHLSPSIMVKGLREIHPWPLFDWSLSIYINKVKSIRFPVFAGPDEVQPPPLLLRKKEHNSGLVILNAYR